MKKRTTWFQCCGADRQAGHSQICQYWKPQTQRQKEAFIAALHKQLDEIYTARIRNTNFGLAFVGTAETPQDAMEECVKQYWTARLAISAPIANVERVTVEFELASDASIGAKLGDG